MKLERFQLIQGYRFNLTFDNGQTFDVDLKNLIHRYVSVEDLSTARIDSEWGCLEFHDGKVDIEPKTLYRYVIENCLRHAA